MTASSAAVSMAVGGSTGATVERPRLGFRLSVGGWAAGDIAPRRLFGQSYTFFPALIPSLFPLVGCQRLRTIIWSGCGALPPANRFSGSEGVWRRCLEDPEKLHRSHRLKTIIWSGCGALPPANRFSGSEGVWRRYLEDSEELHRSHIV